MSRDSGIADRTRCVWAGTDPLMVEYHDSEWGVPAADDQHLFEMLSLEGAQAGLSWMTILRKRGGYREAFAEFEPPVVARFDQRRVERLMKNAAIVRNRLKIESVLTNARALLQVQKESGSFAAFLWQSRPRQNEWSIARPVPAETAESLALSRELRRRGFRFVGPTVCYSFMQAVGMVNDHRIDCFRHREVAKMGKSFAPPPGPR
ncbi:MAG: DNA-3-methyladenine glycosylase I [Thermoanaerobaculia bacterium]